LIITAVVGLRAVGNILDVKEGWVGLSSLEGVVSGLEITDVFTEGGEGVDFHIGNRGVLSVVNIDIIDFHNDEAESNFLELPVFEGLVVDDLGAHIGGVTIDLIRVEIILNWAISLADVVAVDSHLLVGGEEE